MERRIAIGTVCLAALFFLILIIAYANIAYPLVGHDFSYFVPHLIDSYLQYKNNGLAIQWYTPSFAGGMPAYPNPQSVQFTLPQLIMLVADPWQSMLAASAIYILVGFFASFYFLEHILKYSPLASALGAIFFNINGFIFTHNIMGQLGYQAFPLLPVLLIAFSHPNLSPLSKGTIAAIVAAILIHSGGFYTLVIFALSLAIAIPFLLIIRPGLFSGVKLAQTLAWATLLTIALTGSKLYAVAAFMSQFPRLQQDHYATSLLSGLYGILLQLIQNTIIVPVMRYAGPRTLKNLSHYIGYIHNIAGTDYGLWEFDVSLSPGLFLLFGTSLFLIIKNLKEVPSRITRRNLVLGLCIVIALWITTEFRLTSGWIYPHLQNLPILESLHVNLRFTSAIILPVSLAGAWVFDKIRRQLAGWSALAAFSVLCALTLLAPISYFAIPPFNFEYFYNIEQSMTVFKNIKQGQSYPIEQLVMNNDFYNVNLLLQNSTDINPYEPVFGYKLEDFHPQTHPGPVGQQDNGYFNITNPASLVFPKENNLQPFERIRTADKANFEIFVNHGQPNWNLPWFQRLLDGLMAVSAVSVLLIACGKLVHHLVRSWHARNI